MLVYFFSNGSLFYNATFKTLISNSVDRSGTEAVCNQDQNCLLPSLGMNLKAKNVHECVIKKVIY